MRFSRNFRVSSRLLVLVSVLVCIFNQAEVTAKVTPKSPQAVRSTATTKSGDKPGIFDLLQKVIYDQELSKPESLKSKSKLVSRSTPRIVPSTIQKNNKKSLPKTSNKPSFRTELLRQELSKESQENCLAKLLCGEGNQSQLPPGLKNNGTDSSGVLNDYSLLVKEFLDIFSDDPPADKSKPLKKGEQNDVDDDDENDNDDENDDGDTARSGEKFVNITTSLISNPDEEIITTSSTSTVTSVTTGATITDLYPVPITFTTTTSTTPVTNPVDASESNKITLEEVVSEDQAKRKELNSGRKSRYLEFALSFGNERKSKYINRKIREMRSAKTNTEKLKIAGKIAARLREPRQCREFENVASEILSTCPLTAEVVRYFNSNLKNGTQIALLKQNQNVTKIGGGLVVLNDRGGVPHPYFLDNSPIIANTYINTDLKNPSVGDRFPLDNSIRHPIYENAYPQKFNTAIVSLANDPKRKNSKKTQKRDSDEDEAESDENDEDDEDQNDDDDDVENEGRHVDSNDEERETGNGYNTRSQINHSKKKQQNNRISIKIKSQTKKAPPQQTRQLPQKKGVIKVYGVYQPSFDSEFSQTSTQIGTGPVRLFDHDYDGVDVRYQKPKPATPTRKPKPVTPPKTKVTSKPESEQASNSDEEDDEAQDDEDAQEEEEPEEETQDDDQEEDEEEEDDDVEDYRKRSIVQKPTLQSTSKTLKQLHQDRQNPAYRRPHNFATTPNYGSFPAPRREEYYQNGKPLRPRPPTPMYSTPMVYKPRPELRRLNIVHAPGAALMRPPITRRGHYQRY